MKIFRAILAIPIGFSVLMIIAGLRLKFHWDGLGGMQDVLLIILCPTLLIPSRIAVKWLPAAIFVALFPICFGLYVISITGVRQWNMAQAALVFGIFCKPVAVGLQRWRKDFQQGGPGYPPQGVGSPDP